MRQTEPRGRAIGRGTLHLSLPRTVLWSLVLGLGLELGGVCYRLSLVQFYAPSIYQLVIGVQSINLKMLYM